MIRTILTATDKVLQLILPEAWMGKTVEVIAFATDDLSPQSPITVKPIGQREITVIDVPSTPYRFDRDELHER